MVPELHIPIGIAFCSTFYNTWSVHDRTALDSLRGQAPFWHRLTGEVVLFGCPRDSFLCLLYLPPFITIHLPESVGLQVSTLFCTLLTQVPRPSACHSVWQNHTQHSWKYPWVLLGIVSQYTHRFSRCKAVCCLSSSLDAPRTLRFHIVDWWYHTIPF